MKRALLLIGLMWLPLCSVHAGVVAASGTMRSASPSEESLRQLMVAMQSPKLLDSIQSQVDASLEAGMRAGIGDAKMTPNQRKIVDDVRAKVSALLHEELSWERFEPLLIDAYRQTFSQREVDGMLAFYRSEAGQAVISKMPRVMEITMKRTQDMVASMNPRIQRIVAEMAEAIKADAAQASTAPRP